MLVWTACFSLCWWRVSCCGVLFLRCWCLVFTLPEFWCLWFSDSDLCEQSVQYASVQRCRPFGPEMSVFLRCGGFGSLHYAGCVWPLGFEVAKPLTRMQPGQFPNELRLMIPDLGIAPEGFHDIVIADLSATPAWRSHHLLPGDVTSLHRRWPKILFRTMRKRRLVEMEQLRRDCCDWLECRHSHPGRCSLCQEYVATALDRHMMNVHLELGQLWRCPVEWCTVWKGSLCDCLGHLHEKHGGSQYVAMNNLGKFFPPWTVPQRLLAGGPSPGCVWCGGGCPAVPRFWMPVGTQIPGVL